MERVAIMRDDNVSLSDIRHFVRTQLVSRQGSAIGSAKVAADEIGGLEDGGFSHLTSAELQQIEDRHAATGKGPWQACGYHSGDEKTCQCGMLWDRSSDNMIARFTRGEWGDEYAALRSTTGTALDATITVEAYTEKIVYGSVPDNQAAANIIFAVHAHEDVPRLIAEVRRLRDICGMDRL